MELEFGSVCSGIEAASVAWGPLGWKAAWFAEVAPFPAAVLAHHYPHVPNLGDMTTIARRVLSGEVKAPGLLCGGTPCQAFSVAGLRKSLDDDRGNLTLKFVELADAIDHVRVRAGLPPADIFWENVPGVLSTKDNAFGCFLAGLAGEDEPLVSPRPADKDGRRTWSNAGCVYGPKRAIAWRTMDAQYFGLAQRRRRVFVVASAAEGFDPATVLFEWEGLRRDSPPSRQAGQATACGTLRSTDGGSDVDHGRAGHLQPVEAFGGNRTSGSIEVAPALLAQPGSGYKGDFESETFLVQPLAFDTTQVTSAANRSNPKPGDPCHPLAAGAHPPSITYAVRTANTSANGHGVALDVCHTLDQAQGQAIAFPARLSGTQHASAEELAPSMCALNPTAVAYTTKLHNTQSNQAGKVYEEYATSLDANSPPPAVFAPTVACSVAHVEIMPTMTDGGPSDTSHGQVSGQMRDAYMVPTTAMQVRRLTPVECERLQGFPDGYTQIPNWDGWRAMDPTETPEQCIEEGLEVKQNPKTLKWRVKDVDGPRYKALGNSWATYNIRWLGRRLAKAKGLKVPA